VIEDGRFSADYALVLRRPLLPTSTLVSDLSFNFSGNGDANASRSTRGWTLNMYSDQSKYTLTGRVSHNDYGASAGLLSSSTGFWSDYNLGLLLLQPAYPVVNLQFSRNISGTSFSGSGGNYTSSNWLMSSYYDMAPFRFSYDRTQQELGYSGQPGTQINGQNSAVTLNHTLFSGLTLSGELSRSVNTITHPSADTSTNTNRRDIRLSATPTRSIVADIDFTSQSDEQLTGTSAWTNDNNAISWNIRSELLPGLSLDYEDQRQTQAGSAFVGTNANTSRNSNLSLVARLSEDTAFNISTTHTSFGVGAIDSNTSQNSLQSALQTSLTKTTDLGLNYGRSSQGDTYNSSFAGVSIRDRTSTRVSIGATYRRTAVSSRPLAGNSINQNGDTVDMDLLWQPRYDMGVNLRLSYQNYNGSDASRTISPSANLRWSLDSSTNLNASYTLQSIRQFDATNPLTFGQDSKGLSLRLTHSFTSGSNLDLSYDFLGYKFGAFEFQRQARLSYTVNL